MSTAVMTSSFTVKDLERGRPLTPETSGLSEDQLRVLKSLGYRTVERFYSGLSVSGRELCRLVDIKPEELGPLTSKLKGNTKAKLSTEVQEKLSLLPCATGLLYRSLRSRLGHNESPATNESHRFKAREVSSTLVGFEFCEKMPPIRDQGERGTCVAQSIVRCQELNEKLNSGNPNTTDLSAQFLYWHTKERDGDLEEGTTLYDAGETIVELGTCLERSWSYEVKGYDRNTDPQQRGAQPPSQLLIEAAGHRANEFDNVHPQDLDAIRNYLLESKAVAYGIDTFRSWMIAEETRLDGYITGQVGPFDPSFGGHAITLVGFGCDESVAGGGYFIFDNSWSETWGELNQFGKGRGILPYKYALLHGLEAVVLTA